MMSYWRSCCLTFTVLVALGATQNAIKTIPLNKRLSPKNKELYGDFIHLNRSSTLQVNFTDVGENLSFIIIQVHSHLYNVQLKNNFNNDTVIGLNNGLYSSIEDLDTFLIKNIHKDLDLKLFLTVLGYYELDPIPGGCNLEFPVPVSPFMKVVLNKTYMEVQVSPPKDVQIDPKCTTTITEVRFRMMYLPEYNFEEDVYFEAIRKMTTRESIRNNSYLMPQSADMYWTMRRMVSAYPGTGVIFVAIATNAKIDKRSSSGYSIYVPTHSYACSPLVDNDCNLLEDSLSMFMSVLFFFIGTSLCYFGHWFFKTQIVIIGFLSGFVVTFIIISNISSIDSSDIVKAAALSGLCIGALRLVCWWLFGIPAYIIVLSSVDIGFLIASFLYYISPGGDYLQTNTIFWSLFVLVILLTITCLLWTSEIASMICSSVIGGYTAIYPLDYYMGSNLKYIINNAVRRATVPMFNKAIIHPPCQWRDIFLMVIWVLLAVSGFSYQFYYNKGRPPFPPPPRSVRAAPEEPVMPTMRRRSSVAIFWAIWVQRCRQRRTSSYVRTINEQSPLLEEVEG